MTAAIAGMPGPRLYPIRLEFDEQEPINRLWGIPIVGHIARALILLPHWIVLVFLSWLVGLSVLISWIPILANGRPAEWMYSLYGGMFRLSARVAAYMLMLTDTYPPFGFDAPHPVRLEIDPDQSVANLWGIPFIGVWIRSIFLVPHFIALWFVTLAAFFVLVFSWIPVLLNGRMAPWGYEFLGGTTRWTTRVTLYLLMLTDAYPPFRLRD